MHRHIDIDEVCIAGQQLLPPSFNLLDVVLPYKGYLLEGGR
ncbi:hypothetical protein SDC9_191598 [bioreactor metagenome]|uniref:Uncharacterized protein n=1 Tax=bioreactor metagenome TaxID=1076179 RepID=A0A645HYE3_9ZZZZ